MPLQLHPPYGYALPEMFETESAAGTQARKRRRVDFAAHNADHPSEINDRHAYPLAHELLAEGVVQAERQRRERREEGHARQHALH